MSAKDRMLSYLKPGQYDNDKVMLAVYETQGVEIDDLNLTLDEILDQFFIQRATWGLYIYEEQYGLPVDEGQDPETRRSRIMARKRKGRKSGLLRILRAVEPTLSLAWGRLILPFTLESEADIYDFGPLIVLLERHKPAHLGYTFRVLPSLPGSGYVVYANHAVRHQVNLELRAGSAITGRWPWWNSFGHLQAKTTQVKAMSLNGTSTFDLAAQLYSGPVRANSNAGVVLTDKPSVQQINVVATSTFVRSGTNQAGTIPTVTVSGALKLLAVNSDGDAVTGTGHQFPCGIYRCGEEVA